MKTKEHRVKKSERPKLPSTESPQHDYFHGSGGVVLHRIRIGELVGQWHSYQQVATLKTPSALYHACTDYFHGSLPTNCVFVITEIQ